MNRARSCGVRLSTLAIGLCQKLCTAKRSAARGVPLPSAPLTQAGVVFQPKCCGSDRPAHRPFRGLLGVHSRHGLYPCAVTNSWHANRRLQPRCRTSHTHHFRSKLLTRINASTLSPFIELTWRSDRRRRIMRGYGRPSAITTGAIVLGVAVLSTTPTLAQTQAPKQEHKLTLRVIMQELGTA